MPAAASDDFEIEDGVLVKYHGTERDVLVVPDNVTTIGLRAFPLRMQERLCWEKM